MCLHRKPPEHTVGAKRNLSSHLLLISNDMSEAKWEIWISFLCRQSFIHWQKPQTWEDDFSNLDPSWSAPGDHVDVGGGGGCTGGVQSWQDPHPVSCMSELMGCFTEKLGENDAKVGKDGRSTSLSMQSAVAKQASEKMGQP